MWSWYINGQFYCVLNTTFYPPRMSRDSSNCRQSVSQSFIGAFSVPPTMKTDMISSFNQLPLESVTTVQSYPFIPISILLVWFLAARRDSKIAITRSCHLVSKESANITSVPFTLMVIWTLTYAIYAITDIKIAWAAYGIEFILPILQGFSAVSFPF